MHMDDDHQRRGVDDPATGSPRSSSRPSLEKTESIAAAATEAAAGIHDGDADDDDAAAADTDLERADTRSTTEAYSIYTKREKIFIIVLAATGTFFSPFSANIYFAAINPLAADLHVSSSLINLSLTTYLILQGLSPAFMGNFADTAGRRPAFLLSLIIYMGANIGLALQDSFAALLVLRCLQSAGISSTVALGFGVAADIATSAERGAYVGWMSSGAMFGPAIGPTIGALLAQFLGWRALFWFLVILGGIGLVIFAVAFPETGRNIVGNGSIPPQRWNESPLGVWKRRRERRRRAAAQGLERVDSRAWRRSALAARRKIGWPNPFDCLRCVAEKDVGLLLLYNSLVYTAFYDVTSSVPFLFAQTYGYNDLQIGLSYLPYGAGVLLAPLITGRLMDWNFRRIARKHGVTITKNKTNDLRDFPIEQVRIQIVWPMVLIGCAATLAYGWVMEFNCSVAAPLVLLFFIGLFLCGGFSSTGVMFVDYYPESPATATAANNLCRCLMGAGGTAIINIMIVKMGRGWCYTFISLVVVASSFILLVLQKFGPKWREERRVRIAEKKHKQEALRESEKRAP